MTQKEVRIEARVRNNVLWHAIYDMWPSVAEFCRDSGFNQISIGAYLNLKQIPISTEGKFKGRWKPSAQKLAEYLGIPLEDLFPLYLYDLPNKQVTLELSQKQLATTEQLDLLPAPKTVEDEMVRRDFLEATTEVLKTLWPREERIIRMRFGLDEDREATLKEVSQALGVTPERVKQLESRALQKLRHPSCNKKLREFLET